MVVRGWRLIGGALALCAAAAVVSASLVHQREEVQLTQRAVRLQPSMNQWRSDLERDARKLRHLRKTAEKEIHQVAVELSRMQTRVVHLESLAKRLIDRAQFEGHEFDFSRQPGLGGPEEFVIEEGESYSDRLPTTRSLSDQLEDRWQQLQILEDLLKWRELNASLHPEGSPVRTAYVSSGFGVRIDPFTGRSATHKGMDFAGRLGTEVVAVAAGIVTWSGWLSGYGEMVEIDHGNAHVTRYAHNSQNLVEVGDVVTRGQAIAKLGSTGRATGPNLHFEVLQDGRAVNPLPYIE